MGLFYVCNLAYIFKGKKIQAEKIKSLALWLNIRRAGSSPASGTIIISSNREWCVENLDTRADFVLLVRYAAISAGDSESR